MDRRTTLKSMLAAGLLGTSAFSIFKWLKINKVPDSKMLLSKKDLIAELAEIIIPRTDTPGAKDARVEEFIVKIILNCTDTKDQNIFVEGLQNVEDYCNNNFEKSFKNCNAAEKVQILSHFESKANRSNRLISKIEGKFFGRPFYAQLKELTVIGYCTSEQGATKGLAYDYIPGKYEPCTKLQPDQKSWATK